MILLNVFISLFLGLNLRYYLIPLGIVIVLYLIFIFIRFKKKVGLISLTFLAVGIGVSFLRFSFSDQKFEGFVIESKENYFILTNGLERFYVYEKDNKREIGDYLSIIGEKNKLDFEVLESSFDFNDYLNKKGVDYEITNYKIAVKFQTPFRCKSYKNNFLNNFKSETASFLSLLMFSSDYEGEDALMMETIQLNRLMSTSGFYLHAIMYLLTLLFSTFLKERTSKWISFSIITIFTIFLFPKFNVLRFGAFTLFSLINDYVLKRKIIYIDRLSIIGISFLTIDYHLAYTDSFLIGFSLPLVIYFTRFTFNRFKWYLKPILMTLSIYVFMIPFTIKFNNFINLLALPIQCLLSPVFIVFYCLAFISFLGIPIYPLIEIFYIFVHELLGFFKNFALNLYSPSLPFGFIFIYEFLYFAFHYYFSILFKPIYKRILLCFVGFLSLNFLPINNLLTQEVSFINVGQGDATLIRKGNTAVLIDTGGNKYNDIARNVLIPYFRRNRIYDLDAVIITHDDFDHNGALSTLSQNFKVKTVLDDKEDFPYKINGILFNNLNRYEFDNDNDNSLVINFEMWGKKFLVMGDASIEVEEKILKDNKDLECDYLRVGHHGSNTSTSDKFIKAIDPDEAIISVGRNYYGHPHEDVLYVLYSNNVEIRRTDIEGTISYRNYIFM